MAGKVVHWKREPYDFYVGRNGAHYNVPGEKDAFLENPFPLQRYGRREAILKFEDYARARMTHDRDFRERIRGCYGKVLGCWCYPLACHAHVVLKLAEELHSQEGETRSD